jgi:ABC-2 type transport system ATP-binding protein
LTKRYKGCLAVDDASFEIHRGQLIGLVGKNGAGKTTIIRLLTGVATPTKGIYSLFGAKTVQENTANLRKVAAMVEQPALYENLTPRENLMTRCILMGIEHPDQTGYIKSKLEFVGLPDAYLDKRKVKDYSLGMRQRVGIAMAMVGEPELMILDEPTNGLDPEGIRQIRELLLRLNKEMGVTMIVSSHILSELSKFASSYIFIDKGHILKQISASDLEAQVGKVLLIKTNDNASALSFFKEKGYDLEESEGNLYFHDVKDPAVVVTELIQAGYQLKALKEEENTLEDYFVNLVGGTH